jgi:hypothetical protein
MSHLRKSVSTLGIERWWECGWAYVMPDFDHSGHSIIEWLGYEKPIEPSSSVALREYSQNEEPHERTSNGAGRWPQ